MRKQEILTKLIEHYKWCIENMPEEGWIKFLRENNVQYGICYCATCKFKTEIYDEKWVLKNADTVERWFKIPLYSTRYTEAKELLQKRVDIMEKEILIVE